MTTFPEDIEIIGTTYATQTV
ncbi:uncharacterized protein CPUR_08723 [Claviceps purpurea 20.1]|uniref:Uncharacterized protein n=1 Tax=Claviceps purpurea (strain 20.1) TaxID=1111077 RepID=M1VZB2_CLAP2|nr:uncharacterized protein CPUR_08723 [Claviceps purpurea 20.1]